VLAFLQRMGMAKGVFGNSRAWTVIGVGAFGIRTLRKMARREPEVLLREKLGPGQRMEIINTGVPRKGRRR
jgi:hypothetical protein